MGIFSGSDTNAERFEQLAQIVDLGLKNFRKTGAALKEIRDKELYKARYGTFEKCCRERWNISVSYASRLIDAHEFCEEVLPTGNVPTHERQIRQLRELPKEQRAEAWEEASAHGATPAAIEKAVSKRRRKPKKLKTIRLRAAGAWIIIQPNKKFHSVELTLTEALKMIREQARDAA